MRGKVRKRLISQNQLASTKSLFFHCHHNPSDVVFPYFLEHIHLFFLAVIDTREILYYTHQFSQFLNNQKMCLNAVFEKRGQAGVTKEPIVA